jgi:protein-S-isoprenylcysteine O-methyltransferase Ste14
MRRALSSSKGRDANVGCGYLGIAGFVALEAVARRRGSASSLRANRDDHGTTRMIVGAYALAGLSAPLVQRIRGPRLPPSAVPAGLALEGIGLVVRAWSMRTLGRSYSRTLRATEEQHVIDTGPYRYVRHPGYLGSLLIWKGFALTSRSLPVVVSVGALLGGAYWRRITAEEELLGRELPGYTAYANRTSRLVPHIW